MKTKPNIDWENKFNEEFTYAFTETGLLDTYGSKQLIFKAIVQFIKDLLAQHDRQWKHKGYINATPDGNYALRILQAARQDCETLWSDNTAGFPIKNPLLKELNDMQRQRAKELDTAIEIIEGK